jgi:hypothetical protein
LALVLKYIFITLFIFDQQKSFKVVALARLFVRAAAQSPPPLLL